MNVEIDGIKFEIIDESGLAGSFLPELRDVMRWPEFRGLLGKASEVHGMLTFELLAERGLSSSDGAHIKIDLNADQVEYRVDVNAWDEWERQFDHLDDAGYQEAVRRYSEENQWAVFSVKRQLFHELFHSAYHSKIGQISYGFKPYEPETIQATNRFMWKRYAEPYRRDHNSWRFR